jgi:hypothetical protein
VAAARRRGRSQRRVRQAVVAAVADPPVAVGVLAADAAAERGDER